MDDTASLKSVSSNGTKRKRDKEEKFYAVRVGKEPGVYNQWHRCLEQVKGFKGGTFKSFSTLTDAEAFVAGENPVQTAADGSTPPEKFYAVKSGRTPGIYTDWPSAQKQILGWQAPKQRKFATREEAQRWLDQDNGQKEESPTATEADDLHSVNHHASSIEPDSERPALKKSKKNTNMIKPLPIDYNKANYEPGTGPMPPDAEDGFDPNIVFDAERGAVVYKTEDQLQATKLMPSQESQTEPIRIYTDGSSLGNGKDGAFAGVGVFFGPNDKRNVSETLSGTRQTNQRAELTAILRALETAPRNRHVIIITDSKYSIDCVTNWFVNWRRNGWKTSAGKAVENKDIIENVLSKKEERDRLSVTTTFEWIKGHANHPGNVAADQLAVDGAKNGLAQI